ncbi:MAG: glycosyl hydrolase family 8, partial [Chitinispirillia bacterium]
MATCFSSRGNKCFLLLLYVFFISVQAKVPVNINSGDPAHPFPQFLYYENQIEKLGNLATHSPVGVSHAEMERSMRDGYQIMMNRAEYPGGGVGDVKYVYYPSTPSCSEGTGYAMLAAAIMVDKPTFDGLWLWAHDNAMNLVKRYDNGEETSPGYLYSRLPGWQNAAGGNSAADGDFDMAMALLIAYKQWGEFMGVNDSEGNPISYKKGLIEFLKGMSDTIPFASSNGKDLISGDIGLDGYFKGGDTWLELTNWASENLPFNKPPNFKGPAKQHIDYTCPAYFREFADFLEKEDPQKYGWNIYQFRRAEASSDWLMGKLYEQDPKNIPVAGWVSLSEDNEATFTSFSDGEDFRLAWRTILNYVWHGNPDFT